MHRLRSRTTAVHRLATLHPGKQCACYILSPSTSLCKCRCLYETSTNRFVSHVLAVRMELLTVSRSIS
ncbi:hypothetical protein KIN20_024411 [Parelaphostrongylus tenuis]|uniref:Uncharacterized protein n=1 Tax=Parelaphostrongylus tenuis TaxID=148309 RepID=A0AAD5QWQ5_PARTN|nr:hypothetical protein KIN20_024411 [Parelaphostrongylus tenuis]